MHQNLIESLAKVDRPGDVCIAGDLPLTMPGLEVDGLGILRLPLGETQAQELIACCRQAPYGKGTRTLVDTKVRSVWELDPGQFQICNPDWDRLIDLIIGKMQQKLGLQKRKLIAHLYNLLVYEQGSFFLPHRDGEKLDRITFCERLCAGLVSAVEAFNRQPLDNDWRVRRVDRTDLLVSLVTAMLAIDARLPLSRLIDHALRIPNKYRLTATHLAAIFTLEPRLGMLTAHNNERDLSNLSRIEDLENRIV